VNCKRGGAASAEEQEVERIKAKREAEQFNRILVAIEESREGDEE
jgi:hypothetical protein